MRYFIAALLVSLCWAHQDWFIWPILQGFDGEDSFLGYLTTAEHELKFGLPAGLGYQVFLSFLTAAVWLLAVWKAWPSELEKWAESGGGGGRDRQHGRSRGGRNRRSGGERKSDNGGKAPRAEQKSSSESGGGNDRGEGTGRRRRRRGGRGRNRGGNDTGGSGQSNGGNAPAKS